MDLINDIIESLTPDELKAAARLAVVADAWLSMDVEEREDEHTDYAHEAIARAPTGHTRITYAAYAQAVRNSEKPNDVTPANWARRLLNYAPMLDNTEEQDPATFLGYLSDGHTLPRPTPEQASFAGRLPWVRDTLLHRPALEDHPVRRRLALELAAAQDQHARGFVHREAVDTARSALDGWDRQRLGELATFTALLPDELFIP